jgi:hypothetical protein
MCSRHRCVIITLSPNLIKGAHLQHSSVLLPACQITMIILLLVYAIFQSNFGDAAPTPSIEFRDVGSSGEPIQTRSLWNIIWSCLSTIFLCTWVSLHPNISSTPKKPGSGRFEKWIRNSSIKFLTYKLPLFLWALLVPEYIFAWAIRQYIMAGKVQQKGGFIDHPVINLLNIYSSGLDESTRVFSDYGRIPALRTL